MNCFNVLIVIYNKGKKRVEYGLSLNLIDLVVYAITTK